MLGIDEYLQRIQRLINELPFKLSATINIENRSNVVLYIKGKITFTDETELHFKEYLITVPTFHKVAYSYHYQDKDKQLIFRFDNAEHHTEISTYPHHKHLKDRVLPSNEASLEKVLEEILSTIKEKAR